VIFAYTLAFAGPVLVLWLAIVDTMELIQSTLRVGGGTEPFTRQAPRAIGDREPMASPPPDDFERS